jgi:signal transduction histidine kinase
MRARSLLEPMNIAAYLAWAAIGVQLWLSASGEAGEAATPWRWPLVALLHGAFLALFLLRELGAERTLLVRAAVLGQIAVALAMLPLAQSSAVPILLVIAMSQVPMVMGLRATVVLFVLANAIFYLVMRNVWETRFAGISLLLNGSFQLFAVMAAWYAVSAQRARDALAAVNADLLATRSLLADRARDSERLRLSRELHDVAGHKLTALKLNLAVLTRDPALAPREELAVAARMADELLGDIRALVRQMRLHDGVGLEELIRRLADPFPRPRLQLDMEPGLRVPDFAQAEAVVRTVQEALTNAARHGGAETLWLRVHRDGDRIALDLRDDGRGAPGELRFGAGLTGMRERLEAVGGGVEAARGDDGGVRLHAWLPVALPA